MDQTTPPIESGPAQPKMPASSAIIVAGIIIAVAILMTHGKSTIPVDGIPQKHVQAINIKSVRIENEPFVGNPNAPVTVALWYDYQCPFCKKLDSEVVSQMYTDYIQTGKVKLVYKDFQFLGPDSQTAGLASRAVWEIAPDKFYQWNTIMFDQQDAENSGWGARADILAIVRTVGVDDAKVTALMNSKAKEYQEAMDADREEAASFGISGTPALIIGTHMIPGAESYKNVKAQIEAELAKGK